MSKNHTTTTVVRQNIDEVWKLFKLTPSDSLRNLLMLEYLPVVRHLAERIRAKLPSAIELDDLIQAGVFGLRDAILSFDPKRGTKFETYCVPRICGAIVDTLRDMDWVPRLVRYNIHQIKRVIEEFQTSQGRIPDVAEIAEQFCLSEDKCQKMIQKNQIVRQISMFRKRSQSDTAKIGEEVDVLRDHAAGPPDRGPIQDELQRVILRGLDRTSRLILLLYYVEEFSMKEIGQAVGISESRVSQLCTRALCQLQSRLDLIGLKENK